MKLVDKLILAKGQLSATNEKGRFLIEGAKVYVSEDGNISKKPGKNKILVEVVKGKLVVADEKGKEINSADVSKVQPVTDAAPATNSKGKQS